MDIGAVAELANSQFHTWLTSQFTSNSMLIAGMGSILLAGFLAMIRNVPAKIWNFIYHRSSITVNVFSDNSNFVDIVTELNKNTINWLSRQNILDGDTMSVGLGTSWTRFRGKLVKVERAKEKSDSKEFKQEIVVRFFFTSKEKATALFDAFLKEKNFVKKDKIKVYSFAGKSDYVSHMKYMPKRIRDGIFADPQILEHIEKRVKFFESNRQWYEDRGIPYKYAILLHGVPGTGKTTLAKYIASLTDRHVVLVSPSKLPSLAAALTSESWDESVNHRYLGILEDIDTDNITAKRSEEDDDDDDSDGNPFSIVTLGDLLNAIDGINAPENFILVATTNHLGKLDPALFRKGRFDDVIEIKPLETPEIVRMIKYFFEVDDANGFMDEYEPIPGANLQDIILQYFEEGIDRVIEVVNDKYGINHQKGVLKYG